MYRMDAIAFSKHIQCTREAKQDCLFTVRQLVELAYAAREEGLLKMDSLAEDTVRFPDPCCVRQHIWWRKYPARIGCAKCCTIISWLVVSSRLRNCSTALLLPKGWSPLEKGKIWIISSPI